MIKIFYLALMVLLSGIIMFAVNIHVFSKKLYADKIFIILELGLLFVLLYSLDILRPGLLTDPLWYFGLLVSVFCQFMAYKQFCKKD